MNPFGVTREPAVIDTAALLEFNAGTKRARTEYAQHPTAFSVDPFCESCQEYRREQPHRRCWRCRKADGR